MNGDFKRVQAGGESIVNEDRANEILDALAALTTMESDPLDIFALKIAGRKAVMEFATESVIFVKDGIPTFFDVVGVDNGPAVDDDPL